MANTGFDPKEGEEYSHLMIISQKDLLSEMAEEERAGFPCIKREGAEEIGAQACSPQL